VIQGSPPTHGPDAASGAFRVALGWLSAIVLYFCIGLAEELGGPQAAQDGGNLALRVAKTTGKLLLGVVGFAVLFPLASV
jgi:hypothetical protein